MPELPIAAAVPSRSPFQARLRPQLAILACLVLPALMGVQQAREQQRALTDAEFWEFFTTRSEAGGSFASENFVSNEVSFQHVIPTLQKRLTPDGVYLGVGPEQNFTYIANLKPRMAVIFDIRRQNAMQHLMYKAVFELSPTRAEFVARLFSRPTVARLGTSVSVRTLFDSALATQASDSAWQGNRTALFAQLMQKHGFALSTEDSSTIDLVYRAFYRAGPDINYGYRTSQGALFQTIYPTFAQLQSATNADSVSMAFLASEDNYRAVRDLEVRNLIVPVVGDFGGATAIRSVGDWVRKQGLKVTAFYVSNVEQYLFRDGAAAERFYGNLSALPVDSTSTIIRSVPPGGMGNFGGGMLVNVAPSATPFSTAPGNIGNFTSSGTIRMSIVDSGGVRIMRTTRDSAGIPVTTVQRDSSPSRTYVFTPNGVSSSTPAPVTAQDSVAARVWKELARLRDSVQMSGFTGLGSGRFGGPTMVSAGLLSSGLATIQDTMDQFFSGRLKMYRDVIEMTKVGK